MATPAPPSPPGATTVVVKGRRGGFFSFALGAAVFVGAGMFLALLFPSLNPFGTETVDRSQPAVLKSIEKLSEFRAATANLQVVVDIEKDANLLPSFIKGEKTLFVAAGRVDAGVDFSKLKGSSVRVSDDRKTVELRLPAPRLSKASLDLERSRVYDRDRGIFDRLESVFEDSPTQDHELYVLAERKLLEAAREDPALLEAAQDNTRGMLLNLLTALGFKKVTITFGRSGV